MVNYLEILLLTRKKIFRTFICITMEYNRAIDSTHGLIKGNHLSDFECAAYHVLKNQNWKLIELLVLIMFSHELKSIEKLRVFLLCPKEHKKATDFKAHNIFFCINWLAVGRTPTVERTIVDYLLRKFVVVF